MNRNDVIFSTIFSYAQGDVNGDRIPDQVYLTGTQSPDSPFTQNITLVIQDSSTGLFFKIPLATNVGYNPTLFLGDFTGTGVDNIMISIASGGSGGIMYYYIYSFLHNSPHILFDYNVYNNQFNYLVTYQDNYKVEVRSESNQIIYLLDISHKDTNYLNEIYDHNGKLIHPITGFVDPLSGLYPVDFDSNAIYELVAYQKIAGRYHADSLGFVQNILKWNVNEFVLDHQFVAIEGYPQ